MSKNKNVSSIVENGTRLQTRDDYLKGGKNTKNKNNLYRPVFVVDSNANDDLVVVKGTHSSKGDLLENYDHPNAKKKTRVRPFLYGEDDKGNPIRIGPKFQPHHKKISKKEANKIKKKALKEAPKKIREENKAILRKLKGRKIKK